MDEAFRLDLNRSWEAIDIKTGHAVLIPKGSHQAIRMLHHSRASRRVLPGAVDEFLVNHKKRNLLSFITLGQV